MPDLSAQMDAVCHRFEELSVRLNQPDAAADPALFRKLMRDYHETQPVVQAYRDWQTARDHRRPKPCSKNPSPIRTSSR